MRMLVQKFGGSSLSSLEEREEAIRHISSALMRDIPFVWLCLPWEDVGNPTQQIH